MYSDRARSRVINLQLADWNTCVSSWKLTEGYTRFSPWQTADFITSVKITCQDTTRLLPVYTIT